MGAVIFYFRNNADLSTVASSADRITDFSRAQGDKIHFWRLDADTTKAGNQAFTFIGTGAFTGVVGQLRYASDGAGGLSVQMDTNGDSVADLFFSLSNVIDLKASDFVL